MMELLGMPFEVAIAVVMLNGILYFLHHLLGDRVVPGWITPAIPLLIIYAETLKGIDEGVGKFLDYLDEAGLVESTLIVYMGDNGFSFGEHGLIDKNIFMKNL